MSKLEETFQALTRKQILTLPPEKHGDDELLPVYQHFDEINDRDREMAVCELILCSPEVMKW